MRIFYVISNRNGLESFIHREMLLSKSAGMDVVALSFYRNHDNHFQLNGISQYVAMSPKNIFLGFIELVKAVFHFKRLKIILRYLGLSGWNGIVDVIMALNFSKHIDNESFIQCHFGDRKFFVGTLIKDFTKNNKLGLTIHAHELYANPNLELFKFCLLKADKIVTISHLNKKLLLEIQPELSLEMVKVIYLSIDLGLFKANRNMIKVLTVSRFTERKGFRELFEAVKILSNPNIEFICIGWGNLDLLKLAKEYGVEESITVYNKMSSKQLQHFYSTCDIFCLPSKSTETEGSEGIPVVLMEAMASEVQVVTTTNGSIPELVDSVIVPEGNAVELAKGLLKAVEIHSDFEMSRSIGVKNREKVLRQFSGSNHQELLNYWKK
jgi:colanic acid/amylovoran biosynthesis glycosyltransferase